MLDIKFLRQNPELVKENIKKKFQDEKLPLVDEVVALDQKFRDAKTRGDYLRTQRNSISKEIGAFMAKGQREEAEKTKSQVSEISKELAYLEGSEDALSSEIRERMLVIPNIIDESYLSERTTVKTSRSSGLASQLFPILKCPITSISWKGCPASILTAPAKRAAMAFIICVGISQACMAIFSYARDFMIDRGFTYCIPPFMIRSNVVDGVMSFAEMENMMYKIEGEDLYLIGTSEHSMIGKFIDTMLDESELPQSAHKLFALFPQRSRRAWY